MSWVCQVPFFRDVLPRDRFLEIFWMLHVGAPGVAPPKIDKIKPLLDILLPRFQELYRPSKHLAIDKTMSSSSSAQPVVVTTRRGTAVNKPAVVNSYNHNMNGVDVADQLTVFYSFVRKTRKWWRKLFFYLMEVSVVNNYLLYRQTVAQPRNHLGER